MSEEKKIKSQLNADREWIYETPTPAHGGDIVCLAPDMPDSLEKWGERSKLILQAPSLLAKNKRLKEALGKIVEEYHNEGSEIAGMQLHNILSIAKQALTK